MMQISSKNSKPCREKSNPLVRILIVAAKAVTIVISAGAETHVTTATVADVVRVVRALVGTVVLTIVGLVEIKPKKVVRKKLVLRNKVIPTIDRIFDFLVMSVSVWRRNNHNNRVVKGKVQDLRVRGQLRAMVSTKMAMELVVLSQIIVVRLRRQPIKDIGRISQNRLRLELQKKLVVFLKSFWVDRVRPLKRTNHLIAIRQSFIKFTFLINTSQNHGLSFL